MTLRNDPVGRSLAPEAIAGRLDDCVNRSGMTDLEIRNSAKRAVRKFDDAWFQGSSRRHVFCLIERADGSVRWRHLSSEPLQSDSDRLEESILDIAVIDNLRLMQSVTLHDAEQLAIQRGCSFELSLVAPYLLQCESEKGWKQSDLYLAICRDSSSEVASICDHSQLTSQDTVRGPVYSLTGNIHLQELRLLEFCVMLGSDRGLMACLSSLREQEIEDVAEALSWAIVMDNPEAVAMLVKNPRVLDYQYSPDGARPIHVAAQNGNSNAVRCLVEAGCDPLLVNGEQLTALEIARLDNNEEIAALLS